MTLSRSLPPPVLMQLPHLENEGVREAAAPPFSHNAPWGCADRAGLSAPRGSSRKVTGGRGPGQACPDLPTTVAPGSGSGLSGSPVLVRHGNVLGGAKHLPCSASAAPGTSGKHTGPFVSVGQGSGRTPVCCAGFQPWPVSPWGLLQPLLPSIPDCPQVNEPFLKLIKLELPSRLHYSLAERKTLKARVLSKKQQFTQTPSINFLPGWVALSHFPS